MRSSTSPRFTRSLTSRSTAATRPAVCAARSARCTASTTPSQPRPGPAVAAATRSVSTPDNGGNKDRVLPSVRPAFEVEVSAQPQAGTPIHIASAWALVPPEPEQGQGRQ